MISSGAGFTLTVFFSLGFISWVNAATLKTWWEDIIAFEQKSFRFEVVDDAENVVTPRRRNVSLPFHLLALKMEAIHSSETLITTCKSTWRHNAEGQVVMAARLVISSSLSTSY
jgi:hypothetical protein